MSSQPKVALVHDDFMQSGGAENLFATIAQIWQDAPIYTSLVNWDKLPTAISRNRIRPSFIQKIPLAKNIFKVLLPCHPLAFESFNFNEFDLVISSTTRFAKSIITKPSTVHICYINSVPRFLWNEEIKKEYLPKFLVILLSPILKWLEKWDRIASNRVDHYIANSQNVAQKVKEHYGIDSEVIYPAVDTDFFDLQKSKRSNDFYLIVTRLVKWKKVEIAVKAAMDLGINLKIVGTGPDETRLRKLASTVIPAPASTSRRRGEKRGEKAGIQNHAKDWIPDQVLNDARKGVEFLGAVSKEQLRELYQNANALIVTQQEDFGIAMAEVQACGTPVIAYKGGGSLEIILGNKTGVFFESQNPKSVKDAILRSSKVKWEGDACRENALRFSQAQFVNKLKSEVTHYAKFS